MILSLPQRRTWFNPRDVLCVFRMNRKLIFLFLQHRIEEKRPEKMFSRRSLIKIFSLILQNETHARSNFIVRRRTPMYNVYSVTRR